MTKIKAVLFDMDGVLVDARDWHYDALNMALGLFGMEISRYDHLVTYDGLPTKKKLQMLSVERGLPAQLHDFINQMKQQYTMEMVYSKCKPQYFHQYALSKLKKDGYKLAVCSNSIKSTVSLMMDKAKLSGYLDLQVSAQDVHVGKPDPEIYKLTMQRLGLSPDECLILEDNENGIKAALASGAHLLQILSIEDVNYQNIKSKIQLIEDRTC
jgi:HAD superfamily hydrolase (TIGR01509 family)